MDRDTTGQIGRFEVAPYWSNADPTVPADNAAWWWVYVLTEDYFDEPAYVGMAKDLRRRLSEHGRYWTSGSGRALAIAVSSEVAARALEGSLISLLDPTGNTSRPSLSWVERQHFNVLEGAWFDEAVVVCPGCPALCRVTDEWGLRPETEPDETCTSHDGPARRELAEQVARSLVRFAGGDPDEHRRRRDQQINDAMGSLLLGMRAAL